MYVTGELYQTYRIEKSLSSALSIHISDDSGAHRDLSDANQSLSCQQGNFKALILVAQSVVISLLVPIYYSKRRIA